MPDFKFNLGEQAKIIASGETGKVMGRAEYTTSENTYWLHYKCADGRAVNAWWSESLLQAVNAAVEDVCEYCHGSGECRQAYSTERGPCPICTEAALPSSATNASTVGTVGESSK